MLRLLYAYFNAFLLAALLTGCASTTVIESPKTVYVPQNAPNVEPKLVWTSRNLGPKFDFLGEVRVKSWTYTGALDRLKEAGRQQHADALIDVHHEQVGFLTTMRAFLVKYK